MVQLDPIKEHDTCLFLTLLLILLSTLSGSDDFGSFLSETKAADEQITIQFS